MKMQKTFIYSKNENPKFDLNNFLHIITLSTAILIVKNNEKQVKPKFER